MAHLTILSYLPTASACVDRHHSPGLQHCNLNNRSNCLGLYTLYSIQVHYTNLLCVQILYNTIVLSIKYLDSNILNRQQDWAVATTFHLHVNHNSQHPQYVLQHEGTVVCNHIYSNSFLHMNSLDPKVKTDSFFMVALFY